MPGTVRNSPRQARVKAGFDYLDSLGFNLHAIVEPERLPADVIDAMNQADIPWRRFARLVVLASAGPLLWDRLTEAELTGDDPVDDFSLTSAREFALDYLEDGDIHVLYPSALPIPLQRIGEHLGFAHRSPLGLGIHGQFGLWFAFRVLFLTRVEIPATSIERSASPCLTCVEPPCVSACPADAVHHDAPFDLTACVGERLSTGSNCRSRCFSRLACPIGEAWRYGDEMLHYFGERSYESLKRHHQKGT